MLKQNRTFHYYKIIENTPINSKLPPKQCYNAYMTKRCQNNTTNV